MHNSGVLRVGMDASYPPFQFLDGNGDFAGFDVDLAREIGRRLGVTVQFENIAYDGLYDALLIGRVDVLISALVAAPEFEGRAAFSRPYFNIGQHLVSPLSAPVAGLAALEGQRLAVEYGSSGDVEARKWERRLAALTVARYPEPTLALEAVANGTADAALVDGVSARLGAAQHDDLHISAVVSDELLAIALHPQSPQLKAAFDRLITDMITDGTIDRLTEKWFGPQP